MSETRQELQAIADTYQVVEGALAQVEDLKAKVAATQTVADSFERQSQMLERENENLRHEVKKQKAERDHYFRAFTALSAQLDQVASGLVTAISQARVQAYGGRRPVTDIERLAPTDTGEMPPAFLRRPQGEQLEGSPPRPLRAVERQAPIDLDALAASIN